MSYRGSPSSSSSSSSSLGLLGEVTDTIKIDHTIKHVFTFNVGERWERPLRKSIDKFLDLSLYYAESFRFIAVGIGSFFFLWGVSKVVEAGNHAHDDDRKKPSSRGSKSKSSSKKDSSDNATVVTHSSRTTTGRTRRSRRSDAEHPPASSSTSPTPPTTIAFESIAETAEDASATR